MNDLSREVVLSKNELDAIVDSWCKDRFGVIPKSNIKYVIDNNKFIIGVNFILDTNEEPT